MKLILICFFFSLITSFGVFPQNQDQIGRKQEEVLRREQKRQAIKLKEFEAKSSSAVKLKKLPKITNPNDKRCFEFQKIEFKGASSLGDKTQSDLKIPYLNRCITLTDINNLIRDITNIYIKRGHIGSRAYLGAQDISDKSLEITVVEAKVEDFIILENGKPRKSGKNAFPKTKGVHLNLRKLEQGIDQINRLEKFQSQIKMMPGKASGGSSYIGESRYVFRKY